MKRPVHCWFYDYEKYVSGGCVSVNETYSS